MITNPCLSVMAMELAYQQLKDRLRSDLKNAA